MNLHTIIFIGRSGCGKGTQASVLMDHIHSRDLEKQQILYVETGEKFREFIRRDTYSAKLSKKIYEEGTLQPIFLACLNWGDVLLSELNENMHLVFDGAPRALTEAEVLHTALEFYSRENPTVIHINVSRKWSEERLLSRGRSDDQTLTKINRRLDWFDNDVMPAIEYYKNNKNYRYIEVNGEQTIEEVSREMLQKYTHDTA